jgi:hypothetical protein
MKKETHYILDTKDSFLHPFEMFVIFVIGAILLSVLISLVVNGTANNRNTNQSHNPQGTGNLPQDSNYSSSGHTNDASWWDTNNHSHSGADDSSFDDSSSASSDSSSSDSSSSDSSSSSSSSD